MLQMGCAVVHAHAAPCCCCYRCCCCWPCPAAPLQVYGVAFAQAIASGGEQSDALAEATAIAICKGGSTATAFARAYSVALSRNREGCLVLQKATAMAVARCSKGVATAFARATVETQVLGFCRREYPSIFDNFFRGFGIDIDVFGKRR